ncbi:MAG: branched-chain amino acid aminotransferase [Clostridia bacterium]|nr:branched-chain amino acid aminotransferase [Clostridia bacterium]
MEIKIEKTEHPGKLGNLDDVAFGSVFTDHMFLMDYYDGEWHDARIVPFADFHIHPAALVLHYGGEIFEGLKAYRTAEGKVQLFRPEQNIQRMYNSAVRMALPLFDKEFMLEALIKFVEVEKDWVPSGFGTSLYLRPFMFGIDPKLGVHASKEATMCIIASPVGSYYAEGINPVKIMIEQEDVRCVIGGTGEAKCGGNYGASTRAGERAEQQGYSQVLWLDGVERKYIEEVGAMNVMFKINGTVVTPELVGSILPGITRKSIIEILKDAGIPVEERRLSVDELVTAMKDGSLEEAWGCGTAAVVSPIGEIAYDGVKYTINEGKIGELTQWLYDELTGIQWGKKEDKFGWITKID